MSAPIEFSTALLLRLLLGALLLGASVAAVHKLAWLVPVRPSWRDAAMRWIPVAGFTAGIGYALWAATVLLEGRATATSIAWLLVALSVIGVSWTPLRDVAAGLFWRAGRSWRIGQRIRVDDLQGRIARLGYRVVILETAQGERVLVPYGRLLRASVHVTGDLRGAVPHVFRVAEPTARLEALRERVERTAWLTHGACLSRPPRLRVLDAGQVEITVFVLVPAFAAHVEESIRAALPTAAPVDGEPPRANGRG